MSKIVVFYNKILGLITDDDIKDIINNAIKICGVIFVILIVILLGFILLPSFKWGWLDRNTMISSTCTIIGGLFGLIAGIIGIMATYGAFYLGDRKEKEKEINYTTIMLFNLLENTVDGTTFLINGLNQFSIHYGKNIFKDEDPKVYKYVWELMDKVSLNLYDDHFGIKMNFILSTEMSRIPENKYGPRLQAEYEELMQIYNIKLSRLIYDEGWTSYLNCINDPKAIQSIINWINLLKNNSEGFQVDQFLKYRNNIIKIIDEVYPEVKEGSNRGLNEKCRLTLERIAEKMEENKEEDKEEDLFEYAKKQINENESLNDEDIL